MDSVEHIALDRLEAHPENANRMPADRFEKLVGHLERTDRYPPVIVRELAGSGDGETRYQMLDGHHRVEALRRLGRGFARCVVWDVDDEEALLLLATLNRLAGDDDPVKRSALVARLRETVGEEALAARLPETKERLRALLKVHRAVPVPVAAKPMADQPVAVTFFLLPDQSRAVEAALRRTAKAVGGGREAALMRWVDLYRNHDEEEAVRAGD
ncbi:MAG: ParB/RepB/Spo0J family partition protein [Planctomycetota bacterium]